MRPPINRSVPATIIGWRRGGARILSGARGSALVSIPLAPRPTSAEDAWMQPEVVKAMYSAVAQGEVDRVAELLRNHPSLVNFESPMGTWLSIASSKGYLAVAVLLLDEGAALNQNSGVLGGNAVNMAASRGHLDVLEMLVARGGLLDTSEPERNPLFGAIYNGHVDIARFLIDVGIDTRVAYTGETMVNMDAMAYAREWGRSEILVLLEEANQRS